MNVRPGSWRELIEEWKEVWTNADSRNANIGMDKGHLDVWSVDGWPEAAHKGQTNK